MGEGDVDATYPLWKKSGGYPFVGGMVVVSRRARRTFFATTLVFFAVGLAETAMRLRAPARAAAEAMLGWCAVVATHKHARGKNGYSYAGERGKLEVVSGHQASQVGARYLRSRVTIFLTALHTDTAIFKPNLETFDPQQNRIPVI